MPPHIPFLLVVCITVELYHIFIIHQKRGNSNIINTVISRHVLMKVLGKRLIHEEIGNLIQHYLIHSIIKFAMKIEVRKCVLLQFMLSSRLIFLLNRLLPLSRV